jgi:hypothetical protein
VTGSRKASAPAPGENREERRRAIEARARAETLVRDELARRGPLRREVAALEAAAGRARRLAAALAGGWLWGLLAGDWRIGDVGRRSATERRGAGLRRERFRLMRRRRALERGPREPLRAVAARARRAAGGTAGNGRKGRRASARSGGSPPGGHRPGFCIRVAARDWEAAERGGDAALARSLARALGERGQRALVQVEADAEDAAGEGFDVLLALRGRPLPAPDPSRLNLIWLISHPEEASVAELNRYDRVLVASRSHAERLREQIEPPVEPLLQFTDPALFHPAPDAAAKHELAFVGNWRGVYRRIVWDAIEAGRPPALYGEGWDLLAPEHAVAERVPHAELGRLYSSCEILLCDHWDDMRRHGFVSNRVFDALACGTFVLADDNPALAAELPGAVPTYSSPDELGELIDRYLADPEARRKMVERGRALVLAEHTAERRAEQLIAIVAATARECSRPELAHLRAASTREALPLAPRNSP